MAIAKHKTHLQELRDARALARRVQRGDRGAFELFYASYEGRLYRLCHRLTGSDAAAATLVEAAFARAIATLPEDGLDSLDVRAHLSATARTLSYERHANGGAPWLDPIPGEHAREVGAANQRLSPRQRITLALRDLEGRPDDEIALALGADAANVPALVARARLRLRSELGLPGLSGACRERLPGLSAYLDRNLPAGQSAEVETHVAGCPGCRAALFALAEATLRYRALPAPVPPGELRSRITTALGAVGFAPRRPRALVPDPAVSNGGRPMLAAAAMAVLVVLGAGVTILASRDDSGNQPAHAPASAGTRAADASLHTGSATGVAASRPPGAPALRSPLPVVHHARAGTPAPPLATPGARVNPPGATSTSTARTTTRSSGAPVPPAPPAAPAAPSEPSPLPAPPANPKLTREIPVVILPPIAPTHTPAPADADPPPPAPPPAPAPPPQAPSDATPATTT